jgi:hypothetical protein
MSCVKMCGRKRHHGSPLSSPPLSCATEPSTHQSQAAPSSQSGIGSRGGSIGEELVSGGQDNQLHGRQPVRKVKSKTIKSGSPTPSIVEIASERPSGCLQVSTEIDSEMPQASVLSQRGSSGLLLQHASSSSPVSSSPSDSSTSGKEKKGKKPTSNPKSNESQQQFLLDFNPSGMSGYDLDSFLEEEGGPIERQGTPSDAVDNAVRDAAIRNEVFSEDFTPDDSRVRLVKKKKKNQG